MYLKTLVMALACLQFAACETYDKVNITYIYQALCPFCVQFLHEQFYQGYTQLSDYINLEVLPVVSIVESGIECSHGEDECFISEAQACAFDRPGVTEALRMDYLYCTEEKGHTLVDAGVKECVNSTLNGVVSYDTVKACMDNREYIPILTEYRARVTAYGVEFVPWIALFQSYDDDVERSLRSNFVGAICARLSNPPAVCNNLERTYLLK